MKSKDPGLYDRDTDYRAEELYHQHRNKQKYRHRRKRVTKKRREEVAAFMDKLYRIDGQGDG